MPSDDQPWTIDPRLKEFASPRQCEAIDAVNSTASKSEAAEALGINTRSLRRLLECARKSASRRGYAPDYQYNTAVPPEFEVWGVSQLRDAQGNVQKEWVKSRAVKSTQALREAIADYASEYEGFSKAPTEPPQNTVHGLLTVYPMGDPHFGMYAWANETGENFDLKIAERLLVDAMRKLVSLAPPTETALVINLGDYFHTDSSDNRTARSGNALDVDTRWPKMLRVGIHAMIAAIELALEKHANVIVDTRIGNHDDHSSVTLALVLEAWYRNNARVTINVPENQFFYYQHGKCLLGSTHGHTVKPQDLPAVMAHDRAKEWGETKFRHWYTGHVHHQSVKEYRGCSVETFRTLAGTDSWHHASGYRSGRDMRADVWHHDYGMIQRFIVGVDQLRPAAQ